MSRVAAGGDSNPSPSISLVHAKSEYPLPLGPESPVGSSVGIQLKGMSYNPQIHQ